MWKKIKQWRERRLLKYLEAKEVEIREEVEDEEKKRRERQDKAIRCAVEEMEFWDKVMEDNQKN